MKLLPTCLLAAAAILLTAAAPARPPEAAQDANVALASRSIRLGSGTGKTDLSVVFSTAGSSSSRYFGNGELRPSTQHPGFYEASYAILDNSGPAPRRVETGTLLVELPSTDSNGDTLPDTADRSAAVDVILQGTAVPNAASLANRVTQTSFSLHLTRDSDSDSGSYETDLVGDADLEGNYDVLHAEGVLHYRRTDTGVLLDFSLSNALTNALAAGRVVDSNTVRIAPFRVRVTDDRKVRIGPVTLTRVDDVYRGETLLSDGFADTAAADFRSWLMQITGSRDDDGDGVSDLSDVLPPYIAAQPRRQITGPGETATFSVTVQGTGPFTFEWQQNGHELSNSGADGTAHVLVIPNVTADDKGSYRVRVTSPFGAVMSESTSLSFR